jgi:hypothetical protein
LKLPASVDAIAIVSHRPAIVGQRRDKRLQYHVGIADTLLARTAVTALDSNLIGMKTGSGRAGR